MPVRTVVAFAALLALLAGCGQTGPLHLPANAPAGEGYLIGSNPNANKKKPATTTTAAPATPAAEPAPEKPAEVDPEIAPSAPSPITP